jgi:hypothetical protein
MTYTEIAQSKKGKGKYQQHLRALPFLRARVPVFNNAWDYDLMTSAIGEVAARR